MKILVYYAIHYGSEWLYWSMRSIEPLVDEIHVFYTPHPSHGHRTSAKIPDGESKEVLYSIASRFSAVWHDVDQFWQEGDHRDYCVYCLTKLGADLILWVDADEVWDLDILAAALDQAVAGDDKHDYRVRCIHFWRSVNWVCLDACMPTRIIKPSGSGEGYLHGQGFYHFGYAQNFDIMQYKWEIHGHKAELRAGWFDDKYVNWEPGVEDVHPTNERGFWNPRQFNRFDVEHLIGDHPYFKDGLIG